jgi:glycerol-3-phosphate acyltransferase PlsY
MADSAGKTVQHFFAPRMQVRGPVGMGMIMGMIMGVIVAVIVIVAVTMFVFVFPLGLQNIRLFAIRLYAVAPVQSLHHKNSPTEECCFIGKAAGQFADL